MATSVLSRVSNVETWVKRLIKICPIAGISLELVKFDTQLMQRGDIKGIEYQQGTLAGYEIREYLLEKYNRKCVYCNNGDKSLQIEHIIPKSRGGTNRITNLTLACEKCNIKKGNKTALEFGFEKVQEQGKIPLKDAAAVNSTRLEILNRIKRVNLAIETGSGAITKYNRRKQNLRKAHWIDAACVGSSTPKLKLEKVEVLKIKAVGHGNRQMCLMDKIGFPRTKAKGSKKVFGFETGDMVKAVVSRGKKKGRYIGKVAVRSTGYFNITTQDTTIEGIKYTYCNLLFSCDGYSYSYTKGDGVSSLP